MEGKFVEYKGRKYWKTKNNYYYRDKYVNGCREKIALHRQIYEDNFGKISKYHDIHHIDGDKFNNSPDNLQEVHRSRHRSDEQKKRVNSPETSHIYSKALINAREAAKKWHRSDEGRKWHSENGKKTWQDRKKLDAECKFCGEIFKTFFPTRAQFCNPKCRAKSYRGKILYNLDIRFK